MANGTESMKSATAGSDLYARRELASHGRRRWPPSRRGWRLGDGLSRTQRSARPRNPHREKELAAEDAEWCCYQLAEHFRRRGDGWRMRVAEYRERRVWGELGTIYNARYFCPNGARHDTVTRRRWLRARQWCNRCGESGLRE